MTDQQSRVAHDAATRRPGVDHGRLTKPERREDLLDHAAALLLERGPTAITMEGVAAHAGVSKALPYAHFDNADAMLAALHQREMAELSDRLAGAMRGLVTLEAKLAASLHAYFDSISERGALFATLQRSGSARRSAASTAREAEEWYARIFERHAGLSPAVALVTASIWLASLNGAIDAWTRHTVSRATLEAMTVRMVIAAVEAVAADERAGLLPVPRGTRDAAATT